MSNYAELVSPTRLEIVRLLPASPQRVWEYITNPELRQKWFCAGKTDSTVGGEFVMDFDHSRIAKSHAPGRTDCGEPIVMQGEITKFDPPHVFAYLWPEANGEGSEVTFTLSEENGQTRLHLSHDRLNDPGMIRSVAPGWHAHLDLLLDLMSDDEARDFWDTYLPLQQEYADRLSA